MKNLIKTVTRNKVVKPHKPGKIEQTGNLKDKEIGCLREQAEQLCHSGALAEESHNSNSSMRFFAYAQNDGMANQTPTPNLTSRKTILNCFARQSPLERGRTVFTLAEVFSLHSVGQRKAAFTLAEVLITLGIIGVVAAMTLPAIIQKQQEKVTVTKLKKMYSILSQAYLFATEEYGTPDLWGFGNRDEGARDENDTEYTAINANIIQNILFKHVKNIQTCNIGLKKSECGLADNYYYENGSKVTEFDSKVSSLSVIDGSSLIVLADSAECNGNRGEGKFLQYICGWIFIDINGNKSPNTIGRDVFGFYLTKNGIIPCGTPDETKYNFKDSSGHGRTAWIIFNENMDYLRCPNDLSWDGPTKCH